MVDSIRGTKTLLFFELSVFPFFYNKLFSKFFRLSRFRLELWPEVREKNSRTRRVTV